MALVWQEVSEGLEHGGYAAWEAAVDAARGGPPPLVPIFARLVRPSTGSMDLAGAIAATLDLKEVELAPHERDLLGTELARAGTGWPHEVRLVAYAPRSFLASVPDYWKVIAIGPGFHPAPDAPAPRPARNLIDLPGSLSADVPVLAVIDEGIGFLNSRFRTEPGRTRFLGVWQQADERKAQGETGPLGDIRLGAVLDRDDINALLATGLSEAHIYQSLNRVLYPPGTRAATSRRIGHGTHVLDLAAGAGFDDEMATVPILAVQLPPASIRETAGRRMEAHLVQGLRWILAEVLRLSNPGQVPPVVLNLSIGSLAGPGDETAFLAEWLSYELGRHARMAPGAELRITGAYGNARLQRLTARASVRTTMPLRLDWRVLPDDRTSSFMELRVETILTSGLGLALIPPAGSGLPVLRQTWPVGDAGWRLEDDRGPLSAAVFRGERAQSLLHLSLAPTRSLDGATTVPPGLWRVEITSALLEPVPVTVKVQRDDTPFGHAPYGRQSWLDHIEGWGWDRDHRDHTAPLPAADGFGGCPVTRRGTMVSFAGLGDTRAYLVGAVRPVPGRPGEWRASLYSAEGVGAQPANGESHGPDLCAAGEAGVFTGGIAAAGILSGSTVRLSGTSMAAPQVARRLLDYFRATPAANRSLAAEHIALLGSATGRANPTPALATEFCWQARLRPPHPQDRAPIP